MLKDQNNPKVLSAITEVIKTNREQSVKVESKLSETISSRYSAFKPVTQPQKKP